MHRIDTDGNVSNLFNAGDPLVPRNPTQVDAAWLNAIQEEIATTIEGRGVTLVKGTNQLKTALATHSLLTISPSGSWNVTGIPSTQLPTWEVDACGFVRLFGQVQSTSTGSYDGTVIANIPTAALGVAPVSNRSLYFRVLNLNAQVSAFHIEIKQHFNGTIFDGTTDLVFHNPAPETASQKLIALDGIHWHP